MRKQDGANLLLKSWSGRPVDAATPMSLAERLRLFADDVRSLSPDFAEVVDRMINRLQSSGAGLAAPSAGELMPHFCCRIRMVCLSPSISSWNGGRWSWPFTVVTGVPTAASMPMPLRN